MNLQRVLDVQARLCRAMANPIRLGILHNLRNGAKCVNELSQFLEQPPTTVSRHLSILRSAGIVLAEHRGQYVYYCAANPKLFRICELMQETLEAQAFHEGQLALGLS